MKPSQHGLKFLAVPLIALLPGIGHALQGGAIQPEYIQFSPADAPDVVNLNTGDFTYTLPLGEVPGPYGSFPLSMSYQAGIGPSQEATWVGLGWTLNPGAINRSLRGTPDDQFHGGELAYLHAYSRVTDWIISFSYSTGYFSVNNTYSDRSGYGVTLGLGLQLGIVNFGVDAGNGGYGLHGGVGIPMGQNTIGLQGSIRFVGGNYAGSSFGLSAGLGTGDATLTASIGVHDETGQKAAFGASMGVSTLQGEGINMSSHGSFEATTRYGTLGVGDGSLSIMTKGGGVSIGLNSMGVGISHSTAAIGTDTDVSPYLVVIPIPYVGIFTLGATKVKSESWIRQATSEYMYGYMYQGGPAIFADAPTEDVLLTPTGGQNQVPGSVPFSWAYRGKTLDHIGSAVSGDLMPGNDLYAVATNGISGTFRPQALTRHKMFESIDLLGASGDDKAQSSSYLLGEDGQEQGTKEFTDESLINPSLNTDFTQYAYDYCWDKATQTASYRNESNSNATKLAWVQSGVCSKYAVLKSKHLNEANRLVLASDLNKPVNYRSRIVWRFMGENSGSFGSEAPNRARAGKPYKYGRGELDDAAFQVNVNAWEQPLFGSRKIEPILENGSNTGRLQGFRITNEDGTQFLFTMPVRSILNADYTTNRATGVPLFIDKFEPGTDGLNVERLFKMYVDYVFLGSPIPDPGDDLAVFSAISGFRLDHFVQAGRNIMNFIWASPKFKDACQQDPNEQFNYSYSMKTNPYATQWLLTEVRGPDFVELDASDMSKNIGYQVKLHYNDPIHYKWRFPFAPPRTAKEDLPNFRLPKNAHTPANCNSDLYHGSFGVKEMVYLESIETATHKAVFTLNDPETDPREDGKGWIQDWTGRSELQNLGSSTAKSTAMPLYVDVQMEMKAVPIGTEAWAKKCKEFQKPSPQNWTKACWWERRVQYSVDGAYVNMAPTPEQIKRVTGKHLAAAIAGISGGSQRGEEAGSLSEKVPAGLVFKGTTDQRLLGWSQTDPAIVPRIKTFSPVTGQKAALGPYWMEFESPISMQPAAANEPAGGYSNVYRHNVQWSTCSGSDCTNTNPNIGNAPGSDALITNNPVVIFGTAQNTLNYPGSIQPLWVMNDLVETNGPLDNQMRKLESVTIQEKAGQTAMRRFKFDYDNEIQPGTLNSYPIPMENGRVKKVDGIPDLVSGYPESDPENTSFEELGGKLKLKSVQEFACENADCSKSVSLPPFRFSYKMEKESPFRKGQDFKGTVIASSNPQDEWGFWNQFATADNHKVRQDFADKGGVAWSLDKIIEPSGGVMEIHYERDTYKGESYADESRYAPMTWRECPGEYWDANLCIDLLPRRWVTACDRNDMLRGEWSHVVAGATDADFDYLGLNGLVQGGMLYFEVDAQYEFEVGCGLNLLFMKSDGCKRHRAVGAIGSGRILSITENTNVPIPGLTENGGIAARVKTLRVAVPYNVVQDKLMEAGEILTNHQANQRLKEAKGLVWAREEKSDLKGGDIRVSKLVKRDIGLVQTTRFQYGVGEMAQYPDSVLSTAFAERYSPVKSMVVIPNSFLPSISRIPGIGDDELAYLPSSKITYPKVTVTNTTQDGSLVLNGKTEYEFLGPETGLDPAITKVPPQFRLIADFANFTSEVKPIEIEFLSANGGVIGPGRITLTKMPPPNDSRHYYEEIPAQSWVLDVATIRVYHSVYGTQRRIDVPIDGNPDDGVTEKFARHTEVYLSVMREDYNFYAALTEIRKSENTPIVVRTGYTSPTQSDYSDFTSLISRPTKTSYYRWMPSSTGDVNGDEEADKSKYRLIKADSIVYSPTAPSGDARFYNYAETQASRIGKDVEEWEYTRKIRCNDAKLGTTGFPSNCDFGKGDSRWAAYKAVQPTFTGGAFVPKRVNYTRFGGFVTETHSMTGFNNSRDGNDLIRTKSTYHKFDPVTGRPTFTVSYSGKEDNSPSKAVRVTPAYIVDHPLARTMFERNMLQQLFRQDTYVWDKGTNNGNVAGGLPAMSFNTLDLDFSPYLPPRLADAYITPYTQGYLNFVGASAPRPILARDNPIIGMGTYKPRFDLTTQGQTELADNSTLFTPVFTGNFLSKWSGVQVVSVNRFLKPNEIKDAQGFTTATRYEPTGFHPTGVFANAGYASTAVLTAEGRSAPFPSVEASDEWQFQGTPSKDGNTLALTGNFTLSHALGIAAGKKYVVEGQVYSPVGRSCQAAFYAPGGSVGDTKTVMVAPGLAAFQVVLDAAAYGSTLPTVNRVRFSCQDGSGSVLKLSYLRAYPEAAEAESYVYDSRGRMVQSVSVNNLSTYFEYDLFGNLAAIRNDDGMLFSTHKRELTNVAAP